MNKHLEKLLPYCTTRNLVIGSFLYLAPTIGWTAWHSYTVERLRDVPEVANVLTLQTQIEDVNDQLKGGISLEHITHEIAPQLIDQRQTLLSQRATLQAQHEQATITIQHTIAT